jgi:hypothetical protein
MSAPKTPQTTVGTTAAGVMLGLFGCACVLPFLAFVVTIGGCAAIFGDTARDMEAREKKALAMAQKSVKITAVQIVEMPGTGSRAVKVAWMNVGNRPIYRMDCKLKFFSKNTAGKLEETYHSALHEKVFHSYEAVPPGQIHTPKPEEGIELVSLYDNATNVLVEPVEVSFVP